MSDAQCIYYTGTETEIDVAVYEEDTELLSIVYVIAP